MKKFIALIAALVIASCAHKQAVQETPELDNITKDIESIRDDVRRLDYYIDHERCFIVYSICLGEDKLTQKECWSKHDSCVIRVYNQWKPFLK